MILLSDNKNCRNIAAAQNPQTELLINTPLVYISDFKKEFSAWELLFNYNIYNLKCQSAFDIFIF